MGLFSKNYDRDRASIQQLKNYIDILVVSGKILRKMLNNYV